MQGWVRPAQELGHYPMEIGKTLRRQNLLFLEHSLLRLCWENADQTLSSFESLSRAQFRLTNHSALPLKRRNLLFNIRNTRVTTGHWGRQTIWIRFGHLGFGYVCICDLAFGFRDGSKWREIWYPGTGLLTFPSLLHSWLGPSIYPTAYPWAHLHSKGC